MDVGNGPIYRIESHIDTPIRRAPPGQLERPRASASLR